MNPDQIEIERLHNHVKRLEKDLDSKGNELRMYRQCIIGGHTMAMYM